MRGECETFVIRVPIDYLDYLIINFKVSVVLWQNVK